MTSKTVKTRTRPKRPDLPEDFYAGIQSRLVRRIGRELRLAYRVLELGCGDCELAKSLREKYRQRVTGVDISDENFPKRHVTSKKRSALRCIKANAAHLDFLRTGAVDAVVSMWALHEIEDAPGALRETYRVIRPGGKVLIVDFPRDSLAQLRWDEEYYLAKEIDDLLRQAGFAEVRARTIERNQVIWARGTRAAGDD